MSVATVDDVATALGRPITDQSEIDQVQYWLDGCELIITSRLGDVRLLDQDAVRFVETEVVSSRTRFMAVADGATEMSVAVDDGTVTRRFDAGVRPGEISPDWWDLLTPDNGPDGAFTIRTQGEPDLRPPYPWRKLC